MATRREAILGGISAANALHEKLDIRSSLSSRHRPVDVFGAIKNLDVPCLLKPLSGLLGVYISAPAKGILVTTNRDLYVQRFTAAHELGHYFLGHERSLDTETDIGFLGRGERGRNLQEVSADSFASEFLLPKWLIVAQVRRQGWSKTTLANPHIAYQLSLRLGSSYEATCVALQSNNLLPAKTVSRLRQIAPKESKLKLLDGIHLENPWANVWLLTERDRDSELLGSPDDIVLTLLIEHVSAGYAWELHGIGESRFEVLSDSRINDEGKEDCIGAAVHRRLALKGSGRGKLRLLERRAWSPNLDTRSELEVRYSLLGKETAGLPRVARPIAA